MRIQTIAVVGAGNMGSGIAQKYAAEGMRVLLADTDQARADAGQRRIADVLAQGVERRLFASSDAEATLGRVTAVSDLERLRDADLVIEAVFEDLAVKTALFKRLAAVCRPNALLASNTSSFLIRDLAEHVPCPERVLGLHYFYHPAKNRLVEVIGHAGTASDALRTVWRLQESVGKTPIASQDAPGFVVNRFFVPWLNEAVRLVADGHALGTIEATAKQVFGIAMGPFELMNVTGPAITLHAANSLGQSLGRFYTADARIAALVASGKPWALEAGADVNAAVADRLLGVVCHVALQLVSEGVGTPEAVDLGARVGLRWPKGPFELMNDMGLARAAALCRAISERYDLPVPERLRQQQRTGKPFASQRVRLDLHASTAHITIDRPDQLNALDPDTVAQLDACFAEAETRSDVRSIVIGGSGKAFVAGADVKFFVDRIRAQRIDEIVAFAARGQRLFRRIEQCPKRVLCRLHGMALGGGAELALACHGVVATPKATLALPETGIGIYPGLGGTQRLTRRLGKGLARYLIFTGRTLDAAALQQLNLAWRVVNFDALDETLAVAALEAPVQQAAPSVLPQELQAPAAYLAGAEIAALVAGRAQPPTELSELLGSLRKKSPHALMQVETLTAFAEHGDLEAGLQQETEGLHALFAHHDALEGMSALLERRRPQFQRVS